ncbi:hypothetical protein [Variovorax boronicumulans]|uniref:hypothetical protein n=1 Tax=Variovorax boronicumulans TaxID=436515 RepID=UPI001C58137C
MKARADRSPLALTEGAAAAIALLAATPLLDGASIFNHSGQANDVVSSLCDRGLLKQQGGQRRDGVQATLYSVTRRGFSALDRYKSRRSARPATHVEYAPAPTTKGYTCPELGRTCHRPGAYDAFSLPSRFGNEWRMPRGAA